jgi:hypothetical protein
MFGVANAVHGRTPSAKTQRLLLRSFLLLNDTNHILNGQQNKYGKLKSELKRPPNGGQTFSGRMSESDPAKPVRRVRP